MPTLDSPSPQPNRLTTEPLHQQRAVAESFGADVERYDRARPAYPAAVIQRIMAESPGRDVLDVGAGTGIAARQFQAAGARVLGVEPDARMAVFARERGLDVEVARFEEWEPAGRSFDAVVAATSWHWVEPAAGAARAAEVLRPGGRLALFWNAFRPSPEVARALAGAYARALPDSPHYRRGLANAESYRASARARVEDGLRGTGAFGELAEWTLDWDRAFRRDEWLEQTRTFGGHGQLPAPELDALLGALGGAIDGLGGTLTMGYTTLVFTATRRPAA